MCNVPFVLLIWIALYKTGCLFHLICWLYYYFWNSSPVGTRPLSCGQGQCWCWFPKIHHGRFHQPERKWTTSFTDLKDEKNTMHLMKVTESLTLLSLQNTHRPITQSSTWLSLRQSINTNKLQPKSLGRKKQCFSSSQKSKLSVRRIFIWPLQNNSRGLWVHF